MSLKIAPFDISHASSYSHSVVTASLTCIVSEIWRDTGQKSQPLRMTALEFHQDLWRHKAGVAVRDWLMLCVDASADIQQLRCGQWREMMTTMIACSICP